WKNEYEKIYAKIPELPFSNAWIAQNTISKIPENSVLHLGILNTLRTWNYFEAPQSVLGYSNTGGFGIDGCVSSLLGASLAEPN
ncbi:MAG TPA: 2-succinyl-5-enolpyruvyl-6-hydroxy-3-cyclohexene-1-carboxylate synthase, partial [Megamonas funiformis]|nr:2-succinyl-5-enolpyruvyl-6-hydroxy-3-cyclohexene-1-carboxylate synthase [Megamonas funiformis]